MIIITTIIIMTIMINTNNDNNNDNYHYHYYYHKYIYIYIYIYTHTYSLLRRKCKHMCAGVRSTTYVHAKLMMQLSTCWSILYYTILCYTILYVRIRNCRFVSALHAHDGDTASQRAGLWLRLFLLAPSMHLASGTSREFTKGGLVNGAQQFMRFPCAIVIH